MAVPIEKMAAMMQEGAASVVRNATGKGGLPTLVLEHGCGDVAEVYPHGATVTRYLSGGREVLWVSKSAVWDGKKAIRGGIPVVFPQFGPVADDRVAAADPMAQHGFARTATWDVAETAVTETGACRVVLTLADSDETRAKWPFAFLLRYRRRARILPVAFATYFKRTAPAVQRRESQPRRRSRVFRSSNRTRRETKPAFDRFRGVAVPVASF
mmetsp:Transcript_21825/g.68364  ORF Transcript_21825/g.68364 Transcript_21825/m.68364 type:complete len:213 (+) Transcript_21825:182-820(+)